MKFSLYSKKNVLDEMQEQTMSKIERRGFWLMWGGLLAAMVIQQLTGNAEKATGEGVVFMAGCVYTVAECVRNGLWDRHLSSSMGANAVCSLLAAVAVTVLHGLIGWALRLLVFRQVCSALRCSNSVHIWCRRIGKSWTMNRKKNNT